MNKKLLIGLMGFFVIGLATALLVPYISNTLIGDIEVNQPIRITVGGEESYNLELYAGQSQSVVSLTEIFVDGVTGHIAEIKIPNFDGEGITVDYVVDAYPGVFKLNSCQSDGDTYYYIGDPTETLNISEFDSTTTFNTALDLDTTRDYKVKTTVIMADKAACTPEPYYEFVPTA